MMGSWSFIIVQSAILAIWITLNIVAWIEHWDPYLILLNLALSFQAAYAAPFIIINQNRQAERDRHQADEDFRTNIEAERRIEDLQKQLVKIEMNKLNRLTRTSSPLAAMPPHNPSRCGAIITRPIANSRSEQRPLNGSGRSQRDQGVRPRTGPEREMSPIGWAQNARC